MVHERKITQHGFGKYILCETADVYHISTESTAYSVYAPKSSNVLVLA